MKELKLQQLLLGLLLAGLILTGHPVVLAGVDGPQQSTTGPVPPKAVQERDEIQSILGVPPVAPVVIPGVPDYTWRHGCGPTAVGNVVGYYDGQGYDDLIPGNAANQTPAVDQAMASGGPPPLAAWQHYEDYCLPIDNPPNPLMNDAYITAGVLPHVDNCIGDYMDTSKSTRNNRYGWSWSSDIGPSFVGYVNQQNSTYNPTYKDYSMRTGALTWSVLTNEIDNGRPMIFLVDSDGNGGTDHFVTIVGYDIATNQYGCHDTWNPPFGVRWERFQQISNGVPWGIWGGVTLHLTPLDHKWKQPPDKTENGIDIRCDQADGIARVLADDYKCTKAGPITKVIFWGSWKDDIKGRITNIHLSIHNDNPQGPNGWSEPNELKWEGNFGPTEFTETLQQTMNEPEWCWDPALAMPPMPWCDYNLWRYEIEIDPSKAFIQEGEPDNPVTYWLDIHVKLEPDDRNPEFGWKTSTKHWNDDAVFSDDDGDTWKELRYQPEHPYYPNSIDLSFAIITEPNQPSTPNNIKWSQPPIPTEPDNLYYGWNELSIYDSSQIVADDWPCENDDPITDIHWWGSFKGWTESYPPTMPDSFHITIWNDIPAVPGDPLSFSHPNEVVWEIDCFDFDREFVGWDYDPRTGCYEACFYFEQYLNPSEYFFQDPDPSGTESTIYWISIAAQYSAGTITDHPWGWKTRPRIFNDDAVRIFTPTKPIMGDRYINGEPIYWPDESESWDMAFELTAEAVGSYSKWEQKPDENLPGLHCHDSGSGVNYSWLTKADDWQCKGGEVTDLHWYGNYEERGAGIDHFHLSIHASSGVACLPGPLLWDHNVPFADIIEIDTGIDNIYGDRIYKYEYDLIFPFDQVQGENYWFDLCAISVDPMNPAIWRWQEHQRSPAPNLCGAVERTEPPPGPWQTIIWTSYPTIHYSDMAFEVTSTGVTEFYVKWSQPPEPYKPPAYDGWNELSVYNWEQIAADDWFCDTHSPVTDIHWWGSYIGWSCEDEPPVVPDSFHIAIWTDVPANPFTGEPSHPGKVIWETICKDFTCEFEGWDIDPRTPDVPPYYYTVPEACFKYEQDLPKYFKQKPGGNIYWLSIAARYPTGIEVEYPWGWKTRRRDPKSLAPDDAVRIFDPTAPVFGSGYADGHPIFWPGPDDSWDLAFELTTKKIPPKEPVPHLKWSQPPIEIDPNNTEPVYSGWDEVSLREWIQPYWFDCWNCLTQCHGDADCDGHVGPQDLYILQTAFGMAYPDPNYNPCADLDRNLAINAADLQILAWHSGTNPDPNCDPRPQSWNIVADDFRCLGSMPITSIHWWGSYWGIEDPGVTPDQLPIAWRIGFWSNVPAGSTGTTDYSYPETLLWQFEVPADKVEVEVVGTDFYHNYYPNDVAYQYTLHLEPNDFFWQGDYLDQTKDDIFWLSIAAVYDPCQADPYNPWGWKTRPWHWMDDAVKFWHSGPLEPGMVLDPWNIMPIKDPIYFESFDVAFELDTDPNYIKWEQPFTGIRRWPHYEDEESMATEITTTEVVTKWAQQWDDTDMGVDVDATFDPMMAYPPQLLADDFYCTTTEPITGINIYGSWWGDRLPRDDTGMPNPAWVQFTLSFHDDIPVGPFPWSMPGDMRWWWTFMPGEFSVEQLPTMMPESYYMPCLGIFDQWDHMWVWKYSFDIDPAIAFLQEGTLDDPVIYWLDVQAQSLDVFQDERVRFGWKTSIEPPRIDDAAWAIAQEPYNGHWDELIHPMTGQSVDLAFELTAEREKTEFTINRLVADDWKCKRKTPVTAVVWWGSYIGYQYKPCHGQTMAPPVKPDYFLLNIWTDVPADADSAVPFSHPNEIIWEYKAYDYDEVLVGYDKHPHIPGTTPRGREPVFRYSVRLPKDDWFLQKDVNDIFWLSVVAVYKDPLPVIYPWGWTNHKHVFNDDAVAGYLDPAVGVWSWVELYSEQAQESVDMSFMLFTEPGCFPAAHPDYFEWLAVGKPDCWCYPRQCHGDTDNLPYGKKNYWTALPDLEVLKAAWNKPLAAIQGKTVIDYDPACILSCNVPLICADFDHKPYGKFNYRVALPDLTILKANWNIANKPDPNCFAGY